MMINISNRVKAAVLASIMLMGVALSGMASASVVSENSNDFVSDTISPDAQFSAVGITWNESVPQGTMIMFDIRFLQSGAWSDWYAVPHDGDHKDEEGEGGQVAGEQTAFLPVNMSSAYQYRTMIMGDGLVTPAISNITITPINAKEVKSTGITKGQSYLSAEITQDMIPHDRIQIISRAGWGADESLRRYKGSEAVPPTVKLDAGYMDKYSDELQIVKKMTTNEKGELLSWPIEYTEKVTKVIVHHTASTANLNNPKQAIRDIYQWHAMGRQWGDIGYNYIIDSQGNIYEGRYGGEKVIGAHAGKSNAGAIGISVMGNYETGDVSDASLVALARLISEKTKIHGIDPTEKSIFRGQVTNNVLGHRDVMSTTCPGKNLYDKLPFVAQLAKTDLETTVEEPLFKKQKDAGYNFDDQSGVFYLSLDPEKEKNLTISIKNTGTQIWNASTSLVVSDFDALKDYIQVMPPSGRVTFPLDYARSISPGESANFTVKLAGGFKSGLKTIKLVPVINGKTKLHKYIGISTQSTPAIFSYDVVESSLPPKAMKTGEKFTAWFDLKNTGNVNWQNSGNKNVKLGADHPRDKAGAFSTMSGTRIGLLQQSVVKPGEVGRFVVTVKAPDINDTITQALTPVVEGLTWMADKNLNLSTFVYQRDFAAATVGIVRIEAPANTTQNTTIRIKNIGGQTWDRSNGAVTPLIKKTGVSRTKIISTSMVESSVAPGETGTFTLQVGLPKTFASDKLKFDVYMGKVKMTKKTTTIHIKKQIQSPVVVPQVPLYTPSYTSPASSSSTAPTTPDMVTQGVVRVHIGFTGSTPVISASEPFQLDLGGTTHAFSSNEKVAVTVSGGAYSVTGSNYSQVVSSPPRFTTISPTGIMRIDNFERRPEWDATLNDNEFRGILEVRSEGVINEIGIEDYLRGMAETPNSEPMEKKKAIIVAARTYAVYYSTVGKGKKFPGKPYDLDDDPEHTQKYRGYGVEKRSPNSVKSVEDTRGMVIKYLGRIVLAPYFSTSNGTTLSAREAWGWQDAAYLPSVDDPYCVGRIRAGHGVGMSGCGALGMAKNGSTYDQILQYYYKGVTLEKIY